LALKTILGEVIIWCDKVDNFDTRLIADIRNNNLNYWTEVREIPPPVKYFSDGNKTDDCKWWKASVISNISENKLSPPELISGRIELSKALDSTPEYVSYRWKQ
jgi:hypothetical protein